MVRDFNTSGRTHLGKIGLTADLANLCGYSVPKRPRILQIACYGAELKTFIHTFYEKIQDSWNSRVSWISIALLEPKAEPGSHGGIAFYHGNSPGYEQSPDHFERQA